MEFLNFSNFSFEIIKNYLHRKEVVFKLSNYIVVLLQKLKFVSLVMILVDKNCPKVLDKTSK